MMSCVRCSMKVLNSVYTIVLPEECLDVRAKVPVRASLRLRAHARDDGRVHARFALRGCRFMLGRGTLF